VPYFDRLDYVAPMNQEHAFALAVEKLTGTEVPIRGQLIRVLYSEIGRILSHLLNVTTQAMDVGALTPPLWGFEEREKLMVFYERACGARMHAAYIRPGGVHQDLPHELVEDIGKWMRPVPQDRATISTSLLTGNRIFKQRNVDIGVVELEDAGPGAFPASWCAARALPGTCAVPSPTSAIPISISTFRSARTATATTATHPHGSRCASRPEDHEAVRRPLLGDAKVGPVSSLDGKMVPPKRGEMKRSMEALIHHFKLYTEGYQVPAGEVYAAVEAPKGEFGVYLVADGTNKPYRCKIRAPGYAHLQAMDFMCRGTSSPTSRRSSAPSTSCSERLTADVARRLVTAAEPPSRFVIFQDKSAYACEFVNTTTRRLRLQLTRKTPAWAGVEDRAQVPDRPPAVCLSSRCLCARRSRTAGLPARDRERSPICSTWPISACSRSRPSTPVPAAAGGHARPCQVCGTTPCMLRGAEGLIEGLQEQDPSRAAPSERRWHAVLGRGRVRRRLRQRADGR
jgi:NADH-quinone oxidoreductase subunit D